MLKKFQKIIHGYREFREKYIIEDSSLLEKLATKGQSPEIMVVSCCDSRVDPALLLQCEPGDLFVTRNVANIVPPYEHDDSHHGTSAALEFGMRYLHVKHLIILGHSQCSGINAYLDEDALGENDFISNWVKLIEVPEQPNTDVDTCAKKSLISSYHNCLTFPWIKQAIEEGKLMIHLWFFEISEGVIFTYQYNSKQFVPLDSIS